MNEPLPDLHPLTQDFGTPEGMSPGMFEPARYRTHEPAGRADTHDDD